MTTSSCLRGGMGTIGLLIALTVLAWPSWGHAQVFSRPVPSQSRVEVSQSASLFVPIELPLSIDDIRAPAATNPRHDLVIGPNGELTYNGRLVAMHELAGLTVRDRHSSLQGTRINASSGVPIALVARAMGAIWVGGGARDFQLPGIEKYHQIFGSRLSGRTAAEELSAIRRVARQRRIPITITGTGAKAETCAITVAGMPMNSAELRESAYKIQGAFVKTRRIDGRSRRREELPVAVITAQPNTSWQCVAGGIYNLQIAGVPTFELLVPIDD